MSENGGNLEAKSFAFAEPPWIPPGVFATFRNGLGKAGLIYTSEIIRINTDDQLRF